MVTERQIEAAKKRYENHFGIPFPKYVLFHVGNPNNLSQIDEIFQDDLKAVNEAIRNNKPFNESLLKKVVF